jgi:hypothetical protein
LIDRTHPIRASKDSFALSDDNLFSGLALLLLTLIGLILGRRGEDGTNSDGRDSFEADLLNDGKSGTRFCNVTLPGSLRDESDEVFGCKSKKIMPLQLQLN